MQIVFDLYNDGQITTYQTRGKAMAAQQRNPGSRVKKRVVKHGESPRWQKPKRRQIAFHDGAALARAAALWFR